MHTKTNQDFQRSLKEGRQRRALANVNLGLAQIGRFILTCLIVLTCCYQTNLITNTNAQEAANFPGVSRDLASFCSARPSLSIDLASMIVHVKRSTSFNYKLYLFSSDNYVFQTGQIVPRDDFRIHSFPVKFKHLSEFLPSNVDTFEQDVSTGQLKQVAGSNFDAKRFFSRVPISDSSIVDVRGKQTNRDKISHLPSPNKRELREPLDAHGDALPGDESWFKSQHDVGRVPDLRNAELNRHVQFDRDDQVAILNEANRLRKLSRRELPAAPKRLDESGASLLTNNFWANQRLVMPVGAFSSFRVNVTYLVRKDFDQSEPEVVRLEVNPHKFEVVKVELINNQVNVNETRRSPNLTPSHSDDFAFLSHKLLRDPNTRITSISQIYEDWITRNFYTIVYIQRRLEAPKVSSELRDHQTSSSREIEEASRISGDGNKYNEAHNFDDSQVQIVTDRLIFRGNSIVLLGADQLDYEVKASAFITEKNKLHYFLEFRTNGKFHLAAIDWTKRPFTIIDSQRFPIKTTQTQFDNEELLLCPPSVCYSERPIDEVVSLGRLALSDKLLREAAVLTRALSHQPSASLNEVDSSNPSRLDEIDKSSRAREENLMSMSSMQSGSNSSHHDQELTRQSTLGNNNGGGNDANEMINLDELIEAIKSASSQLQTRLHLRDWVWVLPRVAGVSQNAAKQTLSASTTNSTAASKFGWHFEWARRNDIKMSHDHYGFILTGHEIDASYRIYNEIYLISANQLITISYTNSSDTITSVRPIGDIFLGLSSTLLDPITGAFYDRYSNQIYFFKGDRYVGYDYATKKPLEDFLLPPAVDWLNGGGGGSLMKTSPVLMTSSAPNQPLVSSLPVVGILGRQHQVDGVYHDLHDDLVHIFSAMKFYTFQASDFKDGAFRTAHQPSLRCINEHFLDGCRFDEAYPNPCSAYEQDNGAELKRAQNSSSDQRQKLSRLQMELKQELSPFSDEQQMRLRSIAARDGGLIDYLVESTLISNQGQVARATIEPFMGRQLRPSGDQAVVISSQPASAQERIVLYLLVAMVLITVMVTVAMVLVILNWTRNGLKDSEQADDDKQANSVANDDLKRAAPTQLEASHEAQMMSERLAYAPAFGQYLTNNHYHHQRAPAYHKQLRRYPTLYPASTYLPAPSLARRSSQLSQGSHMLAGFQPIAIRPKQSRFEDNTIDNSAL